MRQMTTHLIVNSVRRHPILFTALVLFALQRIACGYSVAMRFPSPSGRQRIEILMPRLNTSFGGIHVDLVTATKRKRLYDNYVEPSYNFFHVFWSSDEDIVGALGAGLTSFSVAYNIREDQEIPFDSISGDFARSIAESYKLGPHWNPFE